MVKLDTHGSDFFKDEMFYIVMWRPKKELRVVNGAFCKKHLLEIVALSDPKEFKKAQVQEMRTNEKKYKELYDEYF